MTIKKISLTFLLLVALILATLISSYLLWLKPNPGETLVINGHFITMDEQTKDAQAMLIKGDKIQALGSESELRLLMGEDVQVIDAQGRTVMPGFVEAHGHFPGSGLYAIAINGNSPPIGNKKTLDDIFSELKTLAAHTPEGEWLRVQGFDDTLIYEKRFMTRQELDTISELHPIYVAHISGHMGVANSAALEKFNIHESIENPQGGEYQRDQAGKLTGLLLENAHMPNYFNHVLKFSKIENLKIIDRAIEDYLQQGVTTAQSGRTSDIHLKLLASLSDINFIPQRLVIWPKPSGHQKIIKGDINVTSSDKVSIGAVKFMADGSIQGYTGHLSQPYFTSHNHGAMAEDFRGYSVFTPQDLQQIVSLIKQNQQIAIHGNGDAAIDEILDLLEPLSAHIKEHDLRPILIHAQMTRPEQIQRMKAIGITPSYFAEHIYVWGDRHREQFIGARADNINPLRSSDEAELRYSIHLDTPVLAMEPMQMLETAVTRLTYNGHVLGEKEKISLPRALKAATLDPAWQMHLEDKIGSLTPGKFADFIILSQNPLTTQSTQLSEIKVLQTWIGGERYFQRPLDGPMPVSIIGQTLSLLD